MKKVTYFLLCFLLSQAVFAQTYILNEDFITASESTPPAGWQNETINGVASDLWSFQNPGSKVVDYPINPPFAIFDAEFLSNDGIPEEVILESVAFDASISANILLEFEHHFVTDGSAIGYLDAFNGTSWEQVGQYVTSTSGTHSELIDVSPYVGNVSNAKIRFRWEGNGTGFWAVDNISVLAPLTLDAGMVDFDNPVHPFSEGVQQVRVSLGNYGYGQLTSTTIKWSIDGVMQADYLWTGSLSFTEIDEDIIIGTHDFASTPVDIQVWQEFPNGVQDPNVLNDSISGTFVASLCGEYTIGGTNPDFVDMQEAADALMAAGITCPVVFKFRDGTYDENVLLGPVNGSSDVNTVTFTSESQDSSLVLIESANMAYEYTVKLNGSSHFIFDKIGFGLGSVEFLLEGNLFDNTIKNCYFTNGSGVISIRDGITDDILIRDNYFGSGANINGTEDCFGVSVCNNTINGGGSSQIDFKGANIVIDSNYIQRGKIKLQTPWTYTAGDDSYIRNNTISRCTTFGINVFGRGAKEVASNKMFKVTNTYGLKAEYNNDMIVANNVVQTDGIEGSVGISFTQPNSVKIINNTVDNQSYDLGSSAMAIYQGTDVQIFNNILFSDVNATALYIEDDDLTDYAIDFNNYYSAEDYLIRVVPTLYNDLDTWRMVHNKDMNSYNVDPYFETLTDYHINHILLNNHAQADAYVTMDVDGTARGAMPDIGAYEYDPCHPDAGVDKLMLPTNPVSPGPQEIVVKLQNQGNSVLNSAVINWEVNGDLQTPFNWNGVLSIYENIEVSLGMFDFTEPFNDLEFWTTEPNGMVECNNVNDTVVDDRSLALCGEYTIGGFAPDFIDMQEAVEALSTAGVSCPVVFKFRDGEYDENVSIPPITGASDINTITFTSESQDSSMVVIKSANPAFDFVVKVNGSAHLRFDQLGFTDGNYEIMCTGVIDDIDITNCKFDNIGSILFEDVISTDVYVENNYFTTGGSIRSDAGANDIHVIGNQFISSGSVNLSGNSMYIESNYFEKGKIRLSTDWNYLVGVDSYIRNNIIDSCSVSQIGIDCYGRGIRGISDNKVFYVSDESAIRADYSRNLKIYNNFIHVRGTNKSEGILVNSGDEVMIFHNSINNASLDLSSSGIYSKSMDEVLVKNNAISCPGNAVPVIIEDADISDDDWNNNDYYSPYNYVGNYDGVLYDDLADWIAVTGFDDASKDVNPCFISDTDLSVNHIQLYNTAVVIPGAQFDIDNTDRVGQPDMGAREMVPCTPDAGINEMVSPSNPVSIGVSPIVVNLQNQSLVSLTSAEIHWTVNGVEQVPFSWSGSLNMYEEEDVVIGNYNFQQPLNDLTFWTESPNAGVECNNYNDSVTANRATALCGVYTVGGTNPDFTTLEEAIEGINVAGISCPVEIRMRDGVYNENISLQPVIGASEINTITITSDSQDSSAVLINPLSNMFDYTIRVNGASHFRFDKIGFENGNEDFYINGNVENVHITNCYFGENSGHIHIKDANTENIEIRENYFTDLAIINGEEGSNDVKIVSNILAAFEPGTIQFEGSRISIDSNYIEIGIIQLQTKWDPEVDDDCYIRGNTLNANFNNVGVYAFGKAIREISRNQLRNIEENTAIHLEYMNNTMIVNNFIHSYGVNMATGIFSFSATNSKIVFNSINNESLDLSSACLNIRGSDDVTVKNNIFASPEGGVPVNIVESSMAAYDWDYNDYASPSSYIGNYGGTLYTSLPAWGAAISGDANSKTLDPYYAGSTELRPYQRELNGAGIPVAGVLLDIDGEVRNNVAPDMGADEFMIDMGITDLLGPTLECTHTVSDSVIILLRQFGDVPFVDLHIAYQVNDEPIVEDVIPGTIYNDMEYTFSVPVDMSEPGDYVFKAWLVDTWDDNMNNDTLVETRYTRAEPEADFFWDNPCHDRTVDFTSGSTVAAPYTIDQYFWTFEGAEALGTQTESYTFPGPGSYDVNLRVYTDGNCFDDTTKTFVIDAIPPTAGEISGADSVCQGDLINYSIEELDLADNYFWSLDPVNAGVITPSGRSLDVEWDIDFSGNAVISVYGSNVNGDGCENQLDVLVFDDPVASVVNSDDNCGNATFSIQNTSASNYTSILWSTLGDGIFNDDQILNPDYTPGANDITAGEVKLVFAAQNNDICMKTDTDTLTLTIIDAPQVFAGNDTTIMEGQSLNIAHASASSYNTMSWLSDGDGVFSSNSNLNTIYTPGANDIANGSVSLNLSVSSIAPCTGDVQDGLILTVLPATSAFAGADASICENTPYLIGDATATTFDAVLWSTSGDGSFDDASLVNPEYTPGANDIVNGSVILTMTVSSSFGPDETDQMQINLIRNPELTGIVDTTILDSEQLSLTYVNVTDQAMITWSTSGDGNFNNPTASHPIYTPGILDLQNGSVELTVDVLAQNPCAGDINQTFTLGFIPEPFAFAGEDKIICETSAVTLDDASATDFTSIQWSTSGDGSFSNPNSINPSYLPGTTDIVNGSVTLSLSVTNDIHPPVVDEVIVTINKESIVILDPARTICSGEAVNLNDATAANYSMLVWSSTGDGTFSDISAINPIYIPGFNDILNGNATLTLTAHNDPCTPVAQSTLLTIFSPASVIAGGDQSMCENGIFVNNLASAQYFDEVLWTTDGDGFFPDPTALSAQYVPGANDIANGTVELTATVTSLAPCNGTATDHMTLTIVPSPTVDAGNNLAACEGEAVDVNGASVQDATEFFWTSSGSGSLIGELSLEPTYIPSAEDAAIGLVTLTLHAISEPCDHATDQVQVSVTPMPIAYAGPDTAINPGDSYHVTPAIAANYSYYLWTSTGTGSFDDPTSVNPIYTPSPMDTVNKVVYLTLTTEGLNSCPDVSDMMRLVINANGNVDFTVEHACSQTDVQFYADTVVIDTAKVIDYHWDFGDGTFSDERDPIHVYPVPENYIVTLTITDTLFNEYSETKTIEVDPLPYAFFSYDQPPCGNQFTIFHDESTADNDYITSWHFDFGDGSDTLIIFPDRPESVPHVYTLDMMYDVTLTIETSQGCTDTYTQTLDVQPAPIAEFSYSDTCQNMNVSFTSNAEVNAGGEIIEYYWDFGDYASGITNYATGESAYHIYSSAGDYTVHHVVQNSQGCTDTISRTITILEQPAVDFNFEANCQDQSVSFSINEAVTNIADLALWHWDFGDGGESWEQNPVHVYAAAGEYEVTLYIENTNGCANSVTFEITIANEPSAMFDYTAPTCLGEEIDFVYIPGSGDEYVVAWMWDFGNGVTETVTFPNDPNLSVTYDNEGTYLVTLDVINASGCTNTYSREVIVNPTPIADMSFGQGCEGNTVQFNSLSEENGAGTITTYEWDFGDPGAGVANNSDLENPIHIYDNAGSYDISLTVTSINGCSHTLDSTIVVNVAPEVDFEFASSCLGNATIFNSSDFVNVAEIGDWHWDFGDGTTSNNPDPEHMYVIAETYDVILTVTDINGCSASVSKEVEVLNAPNPTFVFGGDACEGGDMGFDDLSTADDVISQWIWDFGDGTIETIDYPANPDMYHTFVQGGTFIVTLSIVTENGCEASTTQEVIISTAPSAQISYIPACLNSPFEFSGDADLNGGTEVSQWSWDFGDPASGEANFSELQIAEHIYSDPGTYTVALVVSNIDGCADTTFTDVTVGELPEVAMIVSTPVCLGDSVSVDPDVSIVDLGAVDFISWDMGDGNTFIADSVDHIYEHAGIYEISMVLTDTNGCAVSTMSEVEVFAKPVAQFAVNAACEETETQFTDYSYVSNGEQIVEWYWDFDVMNPGVAVSNVQNPVYMYPDLGEYTVKLIVTSEAGCVDSVFMDVEVIKNPLAGFEFDVFTCVEGKVEFTDTTYIFNSSYPVTDWEWEFEEGYFSDEQHPEYIFSETDQTYDVSLTVTDMNGCENTIIIPVYVPKALEIDFDYSETCVGANTYFSDSLVEPLGGNLTHWYWDFGDVASGTNNNSSNADPFHQYSAPGNYVVTLIATDDHYCVDTIMKTIEIFPQPTAQFSYVQPECSNELYFTDESAGVVSQIQRWEWNWGDGSANTVVTSPQTQALAHTYSIDRDYTVTLTVTDANGCMHSFTMDVTKAPCFSAGCTCTPGVICERVEFDLIDQSTPIDKIANWTYDMGDGNIYTFDQNTYTGIISHTYAQHGSYTITVTVDGVVNGSNFVNTFTDWIFVNSTPVPQFRIDNLCSGDEASFIDLSTDSQDVVVGWQWSVATTNFNSTLQNPTYKFATFGEYEAQLISTNSVGCSDSLIKQIQIFAQPEAEFNWDTSCVSKPTFFYDSTFLPDEVNGQNIDSWEWNFGDTTIDWDISNRQDTYWVFSFTGTHPVELVVTDNNGCTDTIHKEIETYKVPYANFSYEASTEVQGEIQLTDLSENALHVIWEYDDMLNIEENPLIKLDDDGVYPIHQIATNEFACSDTMTVVYDMMFKTLFVPNAFNPASGNASIREFRPVGRNIRDYRMRIFDLRGNLLFETTELDEGSPAKGWTGKSNGIDMRPGVYVYMIDAIFKDGTVWNGTCVGDYEHSQRSKTGQFLLIR